MTRLNKYIKFILAGLIGLLLIIQSEHVEAKKKIRKIVIDAGHGGKDPGCHGLYSNEKDITLAVSSLVGKMVQEKFKDVKIIYTRTTDEYSGGDYLSKKESLLYRTELANKEKADLFISIHVNSSPHRNSGKGTLVLVCGADRVDEQQKNIGENKETVVESEDLLAPSDPATDIIIAQYSQAFLTQSIVLATKINEGFESQGRATEGVRQQSLQVLASSAMPGVLVEIGYLNNTEEEDYLNSTNGQTEVATTIFNGIKFYKEESEKEPVQIVNEN